MAAVKGQQYQLWGISFGPRSEFALPEPQANFLANKFATNLGPERFLIDVDFNFFIGAFDLDEDTAPVPIEIFASVF